MVRDPRMNEIFPKPPLVAYKRPKNIKDTLIRSKMPARGAVRPKRTQKGMHKCGACRTCQFVQTGKLVRAKATSEVVEINTNVSCRDSNVVYLINCGHCGEQYIGETEKTLHTRFSQHQGYVRNTDLLKATGEHFNQRGHSLSDMRVTILEKIYSSDPNYRKERESMWIRKFNSKYKGMNKNC